MEGVVGAGESGVGLEDNGVGGGESSREDWENENENKSEREEGHVWLWSK